MKSNLLHGFLIGIASAGWTLLMFGLGWEDSSFFRNFSFLSIVFLAIGVSVGIISERNALMDGFVSYSHAFWTGLSIAFFAAIVTGGFSFFYIYAINPGMAESIVAEKTELLNHMGATPQKIARHSAWIRKEYSPLGQLLLNGGGFLILGGVFSAIFSFFIFEKKSEE